MDTERFVELGFVKWWKMRRLSAADLPVREQVVFLMREKPTGKRAPSVIYVGRTGRPLRRILGGYVAGLGGRKVRKIHRRLLDGDLISRTEISWKASEDPRAEQKGILSELTGEGCPPPLNAPSGKRGQAKSKDKGESEKAAETPSTE